MIEGRIFEVKIHSAIIVPDKQITIVIGAQDNKYYTPSEEEFCVGLDFEYWLNGKWIQSKVSRWDILGEFEREDETLFSIGIRSIRVKYLDESDIRSFDFHHDQTTKDGAYFYRGSSVTENEWCLCCPNGRKDDFTHVVINDINKKSDYSFEGIIRNKSEFEVLLKQLKIIK